MSDEYGQPLPTARAELARMTAAVIELTQRAEKAEAELQREHNLEYQGSNVGAECALRHIINRARAALAGVQP